MPSSSTPGRGYEPGMAHHSCAHVPRAGITVRAGYKCLRCEEEGDLKQVTADDRKALPLRQHPTNQERAEAKLTQEELAERIWLGRQAAIQRGSRQ